MMTRAIVKRVPYLVQEINKLLQFCTVKVIHDFFVPDVVIEPAKSVFEFPGGLGNLVQSVELTGNGRPEYDSPAETHGGKSLGGVLNDIRGPSVIPCRVDRNTSQVIAYAEKRTKKFAAVLV